MAISLDLVGHPIPVSFGDRGPSFPFEGKDPDQAAPIQLLAYHTAVQKSADVDQPRNLAKSVTVE